MLKMKIAIVTTYPPGKGSLNEYAYHFVRYLRYKHEVSEVLLLVDELPTGDYREAQGEEGGEVPLRIVPCWRFNASNNALRILAALKNYRPDIVLFNLQFASFGDRKVPATLGLLTPALARRSGFLVVTLMHNLMDTINLKSAGFGSKTEKITRFFGAIVTRQILKSNLVAVTIPKYVELLERKYGAKNVVLMPHGSFESGYEPYCHKEAETRSILTFGKFGTYKRVEPLIEAFKQLQAENRPDLELVIAGTNSPNAPGYLDQLQEQYADVRGLHFTGYVAEKDVPQVFERATVVALPYTTTTGSSGVLHQAGEHGKAIVLPHIDDFAELIAEEGFVGQFFEPGDVTSLASSIGLLLDNPEERMTIGKKNYLAARGIAINDVVDWYVMHFKQLIRQKTGV